MHSLSKNSALCPKLFLSLWFLFLFLQTTYSQTYTQWQAVAYFNRHQPDSALNLLRRNTANSTQYRADLQFVMAQCYYQTEQYDSALYCVASATTEQQLLLKARAQAALAQFDAMQQSIGQWLMLKRRMPYTWFQLDTVLRHKAERSMQWAQVWDNYIPNRKEDQYIEAAYDWRFGREAEAMLQLETINKGAGYGPALALQAQIFAHQKKYKRALELLDKCVPLYADSSYGMARARLLLHENKPKVALRDIEKARQQHPLSSELLFWNAYALARVGAEREADSLLNLHRQTMPLTANNLLRLGKEYRRQHNLPEAMRAFSAGLALKKMPELYRERAIVYYESGLYQYALTDAAMALDIVPSDAELWYIQGEIQYNQGKQKLACKSWQQAQRLGYHKALLRYQQSCN